MRVCVLFFLLFAIATPTTAQSTYVGASLVGDIARFNKIDYDDDAFRQVYGGDISSDGEALGFNVKVGRELGDRWGVELEFARTGTFESRTTAVLPAVVAERLDVIVPGFGFEYESERAHTMIAAQGWVRQELGNRVELAYLAGISFNRVDIEQEFAGPRILIYPPVAVPSYDVTSYGVGPTVGIEAAVKFGRAAVTTGVRLQSALNSGGSGWLIRPNVGMRWTF
jgi:hypothetical protein